MELCGNGSDIRDKTVLFERSRRKLITQTIVLSLVDLAKEKCDKEMETSLWNTYHCLNKIYVSERKLFEKYCKNRLCTVCNSIRKADMINKYLSVVESWDSLHFVTLTAKSCTLKHLDKRMEKTIEAFQIIKERCQKKNQRGRGLKLFGIRSLECNFNPERRSYDPHFHVLVPSEEIANLLVDEWLRLWTTDFAKRNAQNIRKVNNTEKDLIEVVKYGSKIFTKSEGKRNTSRHNRTYRVYVSALYIIISSMKGLRLFDRFGLDLTENKTHERKPAIQLTDYEELHYYLEIMDWISEDTSESLSGFKLTLELQNLLLDRIDTTLQ